MSKPIFDFEINDRGFLECNCWDQYDEKSILQNGIVQKQYYLRLTRSQRKVVNEVDFDKVIGGHFVTFSDRPDIAFAAIECYWRERAEQAKDEWCKSLSKVLTIWQANGIIGGPGGIVHGVINE